MNFANIPALAPELPDSFILRRSCFDQLKTALLPRGYDGFEGSSDTCSPSSTSSSPISLRRAVSFPGRKNKVCSKGMGGVGKCKEKSVPKR